MPTSILLKASIITQPINTSNNSSPPHDFNCATKFSLCVHIHVPSCKISRLVGFCPGSTTFLNWLADWFLKEFGELLQYRVRVKKAKVAHTRLPSVGFRSWSRFLAVSLQVTWVINPAEGCHYFPPGLQLPSQPLRGLLPVSLAVWWTLTRWVWTVCLRLLPNSIVAVIWTQALLHLSPAH